MAIYYWIQCMCIFLCLHSNYASRYIVSLFPPSQAIDIPRTRPACLRTFIHNTLVRQFQQSQFELREWMMSRSELQDVRMSYEFLWMENLMILSNPTTDFLSQLIERPQVLSIERDVVVAWAIVDDTRYSDDYPLSGEGWLDHDIQSNIHALHAPELWHQSGISGRGITLATIDTGVRYTHEALIQNYRGTRVHNHTTTFDHDYAFWTRNTSIELTPESADPHGHGTHTVGTAVGQMGIGVAPGSTWITAQAFDWKGASTHSDLLLACQFVMCPTRRNGTDRDCTRGADVVSNSFGSSMVSNTSHWLDHVVHIWRLGGIVPVFAAGNTNGFQCQTVMCPGCLANEALSVGALVGSSTLWGASGKGPGRNHAIKPDYVAPGVAIRSALSTGDTHYTRLTGTSMAAPHLAGAVALLLSIGPEKNVSKTLWSLSRHTYQHLRKPFLVKSNCDHIPYSQYPNNIYGHGLPNVCAAASEWHEGEIQTCQSLELF